MIFNERLLHRIPSEYFDYFNRFHVPQSLDIDAPERRKIQATVEENVVTIHHVGGLHHHYEGKTA